MQNPEENKPYSYDPPSVDTQLQLNKLDSDPTFADAKSFTNIVSNSTAVEEHIKEPRPPRKVYSLLLLGTLPFALFGIVYSIYYFLIRLPDSEYQKAVSIIASLNISAKNIANVGEKMQDAPSKKMQTYLQEVDLEIKDYIKNLESLKKSPVLLNDNDVKVAYDVNKERIENYATTTAIFVDTFSTLAGLNIVCIDKVQELMNTSDYSNYDSVRRNCLDYATKHQTVPSKDFNDIYYQNYRQATMNLVNAFWDVLDAQTDGDKQANEIATQKYWASVEIIQNPTGGKKVNTSNSLNPGDQLLNLSTVIEKRKKVLIR